MSAIHHPDCVLSEYVVAVSLKQWYHGWHGVFGNYRVDEMNDLNLDLDLDGWTFGVDLDFDILI